MPCSLQGDAVLDWVVTCRLVAQDSGDEGVLTQRRSDLVSNKHLALMSVSIGLHRMLIHSSPTLLASINSFFSRCEAAAEAARAEKEKEKAAGNTSGKGDEVEKGNGEGEVEGGKEEKTLEGKQETGGGGKEESKGEGKQETVAEKPGEGREGEEGVKVEEGGAMDMKTDAMGEGRKEAVEVEQRMDAVSEERKGEGKEQDGAKEAEGEKAEGKERESAKEAGEKADIGEEDGRAAQKDNRGENDSKGVEDNGGENEKGQEGEQGEGEENKEEKGQEGEQGEEEENKEGKEKKRKKKKKKDGGEDGTPSAPAPAADQAGSKSAKKGGSIGAPPKSLADMVEALLGAVFLDSGWQLSTVERAWSKMEGAAQSGEFAVLLGQDGGGSDEGDLL